MQALETIDLQDDNLQGPIPDFLGTLPKLKLLNLRNNNFSGHIPLSITSNSKITLFTDGNLFLNNTNETPSSYNQRGNRLVPILVILFVVLGVIVAIIVIVFFLCRTMPSQGKNGKTAGKASSKFQHRIPLAEGQKAINNFDERASSRPQNRIPLAEVQKATDNFYESCLIGTGGFGKVYKGVLSNVTKVAVKRKNSESHQGLVEFQTEIEMLSQFHHHHLVSLIGYCDEDGEMILIYEYMENGTLKSRLYGAGLPSLSWKERLEICIGAAKGLLYLHTGCQKAVIHRDVKSANIFLDENLMAKVADFGISKIGPGIDQTHVSTVVKGSLGYLDPEYFTKQGLTEKSDVYSFGVVLLEVLCSKPVIFRVTRVVDPSLPEEMVNLAEWAMKWQKRGQLEQIIDSNLEGKISPDSLSKFGETAEKCLANSGVDRPSMRDVLSNLSLHLQLQEAFLQADPDRRKHANLSD